MSQATPTNPFYLPLGSAGLGDAVLFRRGWVMGVLALAVTATCMGVGGQTKENAAPLQAVSQAAFCLFRLWHAPERVSEIEPVSPIWLLGACIWAVVCSPLVVVSARTMTERLSAQDRLLPWPAPLANGRWWLGIPVCLAIAGGVGLYWILLTATDSLWLRLARLVAISFAILFLCMLTGAAIACSQDESRSGLGALLRTMRLAWFRRGVLIQAATYTVPRWLITILTFYIIAVAVLALPFVLSERILPEWAKVLGPVQSETARIGRGIALGMVGAAVLAFLLARFFNKRTVTIGVQSLIGMIAVVWCMWVLPFHVASAEFPFSQLLGGVLGDPALTGEWQGSVAILAIVVAALSAAWLGTWLVLYPLAAGVSTFFVLRKAAEGTDYHGRSEVKSDSFTTLMAPGMFLFARGGTSALTLLRPPQGWAVLLRTTVEPRLLVSALVATTLLLSIAYVGVTTGGYWVPVSWGLAAGLLVVFVLPILAVAALRHLGQPSVRVSPYRLGFSVGTTLVAGLVNLVLAAGGILLISSLGLIHGIGPLLWAMLYPMLVIGTLHMILSLYRWTAGGLILMAAASVDLAGCGPVEAAKRIERHSAQSSSLFLASLAAGLLWAWLPCLALVAVLAGVFAAAGPAAIPWPSAATFVQAGDGTDWLYWLVLIPVIAFALSGLVTAIANAYLTVRRTTQGNP